MKLNMTAFVALKANDAGYGDKAFAIILLIILSATPIAFYQAMKRNKDTLSEEST